MPQITLYLDEETQALVAQAAQANGYQKAGGWRKLFGNTPPRSGRETACPWQGAFPIFRCAKKARLPRQLMCRAWGFDCAGGAMVASFCRC